MINPSVRDALTPESIALIGAVHRAGSMAAAARAMGLVPSALTYRVRQVEDAPQLTLAVDSVISRTTVLELCEAFFALDPPTRLRIREESLSGTLEALNSGQADLAIGVALEPTHDKSLHSKPLGAVHFVYAVAPHHPLATAAEPVTDAMVMAHRGVAVADSVQRGRGLTVGLLGGQNVLTLPGMQEKLDAQLSARIPGAAPYCQRAPGAKAYAAASACHPHELRLAPRRHRQGRPRPAVVAAAAGKSSHAKSAAGARAVDLKTARGARGPPLRVECSYGFCL